MRAKLRCWRLAYQPSTRRDLAAALGLDTGRPVLVLTDDDNAANRFAADLRGFSERDIVQLPSR